MLFLLLACTWQSRPFIYIYDPEGCTPEGEPVVVDVWIDREIADLDLRLEVDGVTIPFETEGNHTLTATLDDLAVGDHDLRVHATAARSHESAMVEFSVAADCASEVAGA